MMNHEHMHTHTHPTVECCFSWKPIFAGALVAIGLSFLLNLFLVAIGLTTYSTDNAGVQTLAMGGVVAIALGTVAAMYASGWIAGYLAQRHCAKRHLGTLYGFLAWALALLVTVFVASHIQQYVSFYGDFLAGKTATMQTAGAVGVSATVPSSGLILSAYLIFALFFLSAFAACIGGHMGMRHHCCEVDEV